MKNTLISLCLWGFCASASWSIGFHNEVDELIKRINPAVNLGAVVVDLTSGKTLYKRNADKLYIPASNMKLFSQAAAIMVLGPDYRFNNQLSTDAQHIKQGVLHGNVYLHLSGDPSFSRDDLKALLVSLRQWNIRAIDGCFFIDSALASVNAYPPGWLASDLSYAYGAPIAPLMLDANRLTVSVSPGATVGSPGLVDVDDDGAGFVINNHTVTKAHEKGCGVGLSLDKDNHLSVSGCVGLGQWAVQQRMAIKNPLFYAQGLIKSELAKAGIEFQGRVDLGKAPLGSLLLASKQSMPLSQLMADTLKPSDNLYADSLYLHAASKIKGRALNWDAARQAVSAFLQEQTGIDFTNARFIDGSGLSRYNLITPLQTSALLTFLHQRFPMSYEYIAALPVSGRDGTLQKRFTTPTQQGFIRAKTGTMTGMNSLSGYLYTNNGHTLAFAFFINRLPGSSAGPGRPVLDALCAYFLKLHPGSHRLAQVFGAHQRIKFQSNLTQGALQRRHQGQWRQLESSLRQVLKGQAVDVHYTGHELRITDNQSSPDKVWSALQTLAKTRSFAVALLASSNQKQSAQKPMLLWLEPDAPFNERVWIVREALS